MQLSAGRESIVKHAIFVVAAILLCAQSAAGQTNTTTPTTAPEFVLHVATADTFELLSAALAEKQSNSNTLKSYAHRLVQDHTHSSHELLPLAKQAGIEVTLPAPLVQAHQSRIDQLSQLSGPQFDQVFINMQVEAHEDAIELFSKYVKYGDNQTIRNFAMTTLPVLQQHLADAQSLRPGQ